MAGGKGITGRVAAAGGETVGTTVGLVLPTFPQSGPLDAGRLRGRLVVGIDRRLRLGELLPADRQQLVGVGVAQVPLPDPSNAGIMTGVGAFDTRF